MGISSTTDERRRALIDRLDNPPEPDMGVFSQIKSMLDATFGRECVQILRGIQDNKQYIKNRFEKLNNEMFRSFSDEEIWTEVVGERKDFTVVIHFPLVTITNDSRETHEITDLWVRFGLTGEGYVSWLEGTRTSVTPEEQIACYRHSHLSSTNGSEWDNFCLGVGPLSMMMSMMRNQYRQEQFQLFLFNIREYVSWESISGTPFIRMNTVKNRSGMIEHHITSISENLRERYVDEVFHFLKNLPHDFLVENVDVKLDGGRFNVTISAMLEGMISLHFVSSSTYLTRINLLEYMCYKNTDGKYVSGVMADVTLPAQQEPTLIFKKEPIFLKLINKEENVKKSTKYLHPVFKHELETRLTNHFNSSSGSYSGATQCSTGLDF
jgi:hypothetical protein